MKSTQFVHSLDAFTLTLLLPYNKLWCSVVKINEFEVLEKRQ